MDKKTLIISMFILLFVSMFPFNHINETNLIIIPLSRECENLSFEYFGTRSMSLQIKDMSKLGTNNFVFLIKGWIFKPNINEDIGKEAVLEIEFSDSYITKSIPITETNLYYNIEPHIVITSKNIESIKLFNIEVHTSEFLPVKQPFDVISLGNASTRMTGINALSVVDGKAEITEEVSMDDNLFFLISAGEKPTGGYSLKVNEVYKKGREFIVKAELDAPSKTDFVTQAFTYPQKAIKLGKYNTGQYETTLELTVNEDGEKTVKYYTVTFLVRDDSN